MSPRARCSPSTARGVPGLLRRHAVGDPLFGLELEMGADLAGQVVVAVTKGKLDFGPWEQIFYGEFDGRRPKRVLVKVIGE